MEKVCSSKPDAAFQHLQSLLCTIIQKPRVISHRHLSEGTGASEAGLILERSMGTTRVSLIFLLIPPIWRHGAVRWVYMRYKTAKGSGNKDILGLYNGLRRYMLSRTLQPGTMSRLEQEWSRRTGRGRWT